MEKNKFILTLLFFSFFSCSFDYSNATVDENLSEEVPNTIVINYSETRVDEDGSITIIKAKKAEEYAKLNKLYLEDVYIVLYSAENGLSQFLLFTDYYGRLLSGIATFSIGGISLHCLGFHIHYTLSKSIRYAKHPP